MCYQANVYMGIFTCIHADTFLDVRMLTSQNENIRFRDLDHHSCDPIIPNTLTSQTIKRYITYTLLKQVHIILTIRLVANYKFIYYLKTFHIYTVVNVVCKIYKF